MLNDEEVKVNKAPPQRKMTKITMYYNELNTNADVSNTNNKKINTEQKDILNGLNKIQELRVLSNEDNRLKNHLSNLLEAIIPSEMDSDSNLIKKISEQSNQPMKSSSFFKPKRRETDLRYKFNKSSKLQQNNNNTANIYSSNSNEDDDYFRFRTKQTEEKKRPPAVIRKSSKNMSAMNISKGDGFFSKFLNSLNMNSMNKQPQINYEQRRMSIKKGDTIEDFRRVTTMKKNDDKRRKSTLVINNNSESEIGGHSSDNNKYTSVDRANEDFLKQFEREFAMKQLLRRKSTFYNKNAININNNGGNVNNEVTNNNEGTPVNKSIKTPSKKRHSLLMDDRKSDKKNSSQLSRSNSINPSLIKKPKNSLSRAFTQAYKNPLSSKLIRSGTSKSRRKSMELSRAKTTGWAGRASEPVPKHMKIQADDSPKSIKLGEDKIDDFNLIREELRDNININLKSPKTPKKSIIKNPNLEKESSYSSETNTEDKENHRCLKRQKLVYDSFSDEEQDDLNEGCFIHPLSAYMIYLDFFVLLSCIYTITFTPIDLAFFNDNLSEFDSFFFISELFVDVVYTIDLISNFFLAYFDFEERLITKPRLMVKNFFNTWFFIDLVSAMPFHTYLSLYNHFRIHSDYEFAYSWASTSHKLYDFLMILRFLKVLKVFSVNKFLSALSDRLFEEWDMNSTRSRVIKFFIWFLVILHFLACLFIFLGQLGNPNWIIYSQVQDSSEAEIYLTSFYFNLSTIFTIGYGDINSRNMYERVYNLLLLMVGILIYSFAVSWISNIVSFVDDKTKKYQLKLEYLEQMRIKYNLPSTLSDKISRFLKYDLNANKGDKNGFLEELPTSLKGEMILKMYKPIIDNFIFFKNFDNVEFISRVIISLKPYSGIKNERLVKEGDFIDEILFVKRGALVLEIEIKVINEAEIEKNYHLKFRESLSQMRSFDTKSFTKSHSVLNDILKEESDTQANDNDKDKQEILQYVETEYLKIIELRRNEHFGDILMFLNRRSPLSVRVKSKMAELFLMKKTDVVNIQAAFPEIFEKIVRKSAFNHEQMEILIKRTKLLFYENHKDEFMTEFIKEGRIQRNATKKKTLVFNNPLSDYEIKNVNKTIKDLTLHSIPSEKSVRRKFTFKEDEEIGEEGENENDADSVEVIKKNKSYKNRLTISERALDEEEDSNRYESDYKLPQVSEVSKSCSETSEENMRNNKKEKSVKIYNPGLKQTASFYNSQFALAVKNIPNFNQEEEKLLPSSSRKPTLKRKNTMSSANKKVSFNMFSVRGNTIDDEFSMNGESAIKKIADNNISKITPINKLLFPGADSIKSRSSNSVISLKKLDLFSSARKKLFEQENSLNAGKNPFDSSGRSSSKLAEEDSSINYSEADSLFNKIAKDKSNYPILYNFNISNNINLPNKSDLIHCPKCNYNLTNLPYEKLLTNTKKVLSKENTKEGSLIKEMINRWEVTVQPSASTAFTISAVKQSIMPQKQIEVDVSNDPNTSDELIRINTHNKSKPYANNIHKPNQIHKSKSIDNYGTDSSSNKEKFNMISKDFLKKKNSMQNQNHLSSGKRRESCFEFNKVMSRLKSKKSFNEAKEIDRVNSFGGLAHLKKYASGAIYGNSPISTNVSPSLTKRHQNKKTNRLENVVSEIQKNMKDNNAKLFNSSSFYADLFNQVMNKKHKSRRIRHQLIDSDKLWQRLDNLEHLVMNKKDKET